MQYNKDLSYVSIYFGKKCPEIVAARKSLVKPSRKKKRKRLPLPQAVCGNSGRRDALRPAPSLSGAERGIRWKTSSWWRSSGAALISELRLGVGWRGPEIAVDAAKRNQGDSLRQRRSSEIAGAPTRSVAPPALRFELQLSHDPAPEFAFSLEECFELVWRVRSLGIDPDPAQAPIDVRIE